jgi:hypothetical protein
MVGQVVGAVAPVVVQSATSDDGLINKLFKIAILIGVLGIIATVIGIALFIFNTDLQTAVGNFLAAPVGLIAGLLPSGISQPFRILQIGLTGLASGFAFRR